MIVNIPVEVSHDFIVGVMTTAVESGAIQYWAGGVKVRRQEDGMVWHISGAKDCEEAGGDRFDLFPKDLAASIPNLFTPDFKINNTFRKYIYTGVVTQDCGDIDSICADIMIQNAVFGEIVYG